MSLYAAQKFLYHLNRDATVQRRYQDDRAALLADYELDEEEHAAIRDGDWKVAPIPADLARDLLAGMTLSA